ncbi:ABC transporter permease [Microbacterium sp. MYb66]|uniref:ABC transporter permease n=1 Tax=Microbacterium sp. MYb66 TaxID=1848692 RepID=UPI000CFF2779|nr:ABC transporter permease [Microbacterium sp. MYb66]PRA81867.1 ABC transporter permease [Microbacterium sp. MYb66]
MSVISTPASSVDTAALRPAYRGGRARLPLWGVVSLGAAIPVVVIAAWALFASSGLINTSVFSHPAQVLDTLWQLIVTGRLFEALGISLARAGAGLLVGGVVGLSAGIISGLNRIGEAIVDPVAQILRTVPVLAILPLFVAWFGLSELPKILVIAFAVAAPIYVNTSNGIKHVDKKLIETARVFDLSRSQTIRLVILPAALPSIFNGLRLAVSLSVLLLVAAETINAQSGLGFLANQGLQFFRVDVIFAVIIVYGVLGLLGDLAVRGAEKAALPWLGRKGVR